MHKTSSTLWWSALAVALLVAVPVSAAPIQWTNWTARTFGAPGSATGTITLPGGAITVNYSGEVVNKADQGDWNYPQTYSLPGVVDNVPTPYNISIPLIGGNAVTDTISFSSPVVNPVMAIQSVGSPSDVAIYTFVFSAPFTLLKDGPGHWGGGVGALVQSGLSLTGREGNGIIQFTGTFDSISWTVPNGENYSMFTVGVPVPEPASLLLFGTGIAGLVAARRRRK